MAWKKGKARDRKTASELEVAGIVSFDDFRHSVKSFFSKEHPDLSDDDLLFDPELAIAFCARFNAVHSFNLSNRCILKSLILYRKMKENRRRGKKTSNDGSGERPNPADAQ